MYQQRAGVSTHVSASNYLLAEAEAATHKRMLTGLTETFISAYAHQ